MVNQPSVDTLMQYAGLWIAHSGTEVLASGDTPEDAANALQRLGVRGTVWRVPSTVEEAEWHA